MTARYALLALGIAGLSMAGIFYSFAHAPVVTMVAYRMLFAAALMVPVALVARSTGAPQTTARFTRADLWVTAGAGLLFALDLVVWASSLKFTTVASAALFVSTHPIFVALLAWLLFRERPTPLIAAGIAIGIVGISIVAWQDVRLSGRALIGDGLALLAAFAETGYLLCGRSVRQRIDAPRYALGVYASCAAFVCAIALGSGAGFSISRHDVLLAIGLAVVATVLGHTLVSQSLGYMPAAVVAASFLAQPLMAAVFSVIFLAQMIPLTTALGGIIALAGIGVVAYANERRPAEPLEM
ncbi:MAG: DMT family transporter [Candidatus Eremiobacteraeota bacterium]|nr:DMT family transporter [Candidatus Eremiobacteraeota bacterium]